MAFRLQLHWQTHVAHLAMEEAILAAYATYSARITMVLAFIVVIEQIADETCILSEANAALFAIDLHLLTSLALRTDQLLQLLPVERVTFRIVMAETAAVDFPTARTLNGGQDKRKV